MRGFEFERIGRRAREGVRLRIECHSVIRAGYEWRGTTPSQLWCVGRVHWISFDLQKGGGLFLINSFELPLDGPPWTAAAAAAAPEYFENSSFKITREARRVIFRCVRQ